ncbi:DUF732 domain-containing protein [Microbacterium sp. ZW T5_56]|uniref:DUF732 domain-containing protein n=1 Tax=Microbacterium sp. ZW T5_56 TaxID=3378081 RepID=UPI003853E6CF
MHKLGYMTAVGALVLALTACSGGTEPEANAGTADATPITIAEPTTEASTATETVPPLVAETPSAATADADYLAFVRGDLVPNTGIRNATDEQLIAAGHDACDQIWAGAAAGDLRLVEGEEPQPSGYFADSGSIVTGALNFYCRELIGS